MYIQPNSITYIFHKNKHIVKNVFNQNQILRNITEDIKKYIKQMYIFINRKIVSSGKSIEKELKKETGYAILKVASRG